MMWKQDAAVEAARKVPGWSAFHRTCGQAWLYFDHIERQGKRADYVATAYTLVGSPRRDAKFIATGKGKTPIAAIADAYRAASVAGHNAPEAQQWLDQMLAGPAAPESLATVTISLNDLLGGDDEIDLEDLLG